jgi:hypothetical protein
LRHSIAATSFLIESAGYLSAHQTIGLEKMTGAGGRAGTVNLKCIDLYKAINEAKIRIFQAFLYAASAYLISLNLAVDHLYDSKRI